jgi:hypothetical protein
MIAPMMLPSRRVGRRGNLHRLHDVAVGIAEEDRLGVAERRLHGHRRLGRGDDLVPHLLTARHDRLDVAHQELHVRRAGIGELGLLSRGPRWRVGELGQLEVEPVAREWAASTPAVWPRASW